MSKKVAYIFLVILTCALGDRYLVPSVAGQNPKQPILEFKPPNNGAPGGNRSGSSGNTGSRDDCPAVKKQITALIPPTNWVNTLNERPTFWFYIPYEQGRLTLFIKDENNSQPIANLSYEINQGAGIMGFSLPETAPALAVNHAYRWRVYFSCKPNIQPSLTKVEGVVKRVASNQTLQDKLTSATSAKARIILYANQGLWHETLTTLITSRSNHPTDQQLKKYWSDLLSNPHVKLENFISEPLVKCCNYIPE